MFDVFDDFTIHTVYVICATIGGAILALQMILLMFGGDVDADTDVDADAAHGDGFGYLSVRSVASFLTFFGLAGLWGTAEGWGSLPTVLVALGSGSLMLVVVAFIMSKMARLDTEGNVHSESAVGLPAKVYLRIPGENAGQGKITVSLQGRSHEYTAFTSGPELPTGADVRVVRMTTPTTFEVEAFDSPTGGAA